MRDLHPAPTPGAAFLQRKCVATCRALDGHAERCRVPSPIAADVSIHVVAKLVHLPIPSFFSSMLRNAAPSRAALRSIAPHQ